MQRDRCDYRAMDAQRLLELARDNGIDPEMAIALADALAEAFALGHWRGQFRFNHETAK